MTLGWNNVTLSISSKCFRYIDNTLSKHTCKKETSILFGIWSEIATPNSDFWLKNRKLMYFFTFFQKLSLMPNVSTVVSTKHQLCLEREKKCHPKLWYWSPNKATHVFFLFLKKALGTWLMPYLSTKNLLYLLLRNISFVRNVKKMSPQIIPQKKDKLMCFFTFLQKRWGHFQHLDSLDW